MNKYIRILAKQNPNYEITCEGCHNKFKVKTAELFNGSDTFSAICPHCSSTTTIGELRKTIASLEKQFKDNGITIG